MMEDEVLSYIYYFSHGHLNFIYVCMTVRENLGIAMMHVSNVFLNSVIYYPHSGCSVCSSVIGYN